MKDRLIRNRLLFACLLAGFFIAPYRIASGAFDAATPRTYRGEWRQSAINGPLLTLQQLETTDGRKVLEFRDPSGNVVGWTDTSGNVFIDGAYSLTQHTTSELNSLGAIIGSQKRAIAYNSTTDTWQSWDGATWSNLSASSGAAIVSGLDNAVVFMNPSGSAFSTHAGLTWGIGADDSPTNDDGGLVISKTGSDTKSVMRGLTVISHHNDNNGEDGAASNAITGFAHIEGNDNFNHVVAVEGFPYHDGTGTLLGLYGFNTYLQNPGSGQITNAYGLNVNSQLNGAHVTNAYGVFVGDMAASAANPFPFYGGTGKYRFGGTTYTPKIITSSDATTASDSASVIQAQAADSSGIGQINIRATDAYTTQKGGKITFGGPYTSGGAFATFGQWGGEKADATDGTFVGDLVGKIQSGGGGVNEAIRYKGSDLSAHHTGNVYAPRIIGGGTTSDGSSYVKAEGAPAVGVGLFNARDTTSFAANVGGSISFQGPYNSTPQYASYAYAKGGKTNGTTGDFKGYYSLSTNNGTSLTEGFRLTDTQFLGVGTTSPLQRLQVAGSTVLNNDAASTSLNNAYFVYNPGSAGAWGLNNFATTIGRNATTTRQRLQFITPSNGDLSYATHAPDTAPTAQSDFTERFVIRGDTGNVGVGTAAPVSSLEVNGSLGLKSDTASILSYTAADAGVILADSTSTNVNVALPQASTHAGRVYQITKTVAANQVVVDPSGTELINGASNYILYNQYESVTIACNGTAWYITAKSAPAQAGSSTNAGLISSADWTSFNGKVGGSGTTGKLPKFTGSTTLADSILTESSSKIGVAQATPVSTLEVGGSFGANVSTASVPFTAASAHVYLATGTGTISLPSASTVTNREYVIRNAGSGTVTVDPNSTDPMDGVSSGTLVLQIGEGATLACDGTGWWTVDRRYAPASSGSPAVANGLFTIPSVNKIVGVNSSGLATGVTLSGLTFDGTTLTASGGTPYIDTDTFDSVTDRGSTTPNSVTLESLFLHQDSSRGLMAGSGSPNSSVTAGNGSIYLQNDGDADTTLWVKTSGTGNTGWRYFTPTIGGVSSLDFPSTAAQSENDMTMSVTGAVVTDEVAIAATPVAGGFFTAWVSSADTVTVRFINYSSGSVDPTNRSIAVQVFKKS